MWGGLVLLKFSTITFFILLILNISLLKAFDIKIGSPSQPGLILSKNGVNIEFKVFFFLFVSLNEDIIDSIYYFYQF